MLSKCSWSELNWGLLGWWKEVDAWASEGRRGGAARGGCLSRKRSEGLGEHWEGAMPPGDAQQWRTHREHQDWPALLVSFLVPCLGQTAAKLRNGPRDKALDLVEPGSNCVPC